MDDEDYGDPSDPDHNDFFRWLIIELRKAPSSDPFHEALARGIRHASSLAPDELEILADIASKPWKRPEGRPSLQPEYSRIFLRYILASSNRPKLKPADAIQDIATEMLTGRETPEEEYAKWELAKKRYYAAKRGGWMTPPRNRGGN